MAISLTNSAAERIRTYLNKRENCLGLRLGVTLTGCSGYSYVINYAEEISDSDIVFEDKDVKIVVISDILKLIDGTEVDFVKDGLNESFKFYNPNISGECGCGESFNV
ncbi:MAG: iron-sulfur cluster assembly protein IscA [Gammaproteobacteria bacterium]|nr:iron-sulfur cluster assembly protein IscA [Gammaproteobacteria bacterium]|tara:strand:+ start:457 stop:780 length:324 start_codon:yes stop_codon:yes gene_type:complete